MKLQAYIIHWDPRAQDLLKEAELEEEGIVEEEKIVEEGTA